MKRIQYTAGQRQKSRHQRREERAEGCESGTQKQEE